MILVSGATGFVGSHLLKKLCEKSNEPLRAIYRNEDKKAYTLYFLNKLCSAEAKKNINKINWVKADVLDIPALNEAFLNVKTVYHCAAWVGNSPSQTKNMRKINIEGTANMVNLSLHHSIDKFCHVSSTAALGSYVNSDVVDENAPRESERFSSIYSITKYGAEMEVWRASQEGLDVVIVNPGVILGSGFFESGSGLIFKKILNETKFYVTKQTGFVFIDDVVEFMVMLTQSTIKNERFILVAENLSFKIVMYLIADTFNVKKPKIRVSKWMLNILWFFQNMISIFKPLKVQITRSTIKKINAKTVYDNSKSSSVLNFKYTTIAKAISCIYNEYHILEKG